MLTSGGSLAQGDPTAGDEATSRAKAPKTPAQRATSNEQRTNSSGGEETAERILSSFFFLVQFVCHLFRFEFSECSCLVFRRRDVCQLRARQKRTHFCIFLQEWQQGNRLLISPCFQVVWLRPMLANAFAFSRVLELRSVE